MSQNKKNLFIVIFYFTSIFLVPILHNLYFKNLDPIVFLMYEHFFIFFVLFVLTKELIYQEISKFKRNLKNNLKIVFSGYGFLILGSIILSLVSFYILQGFGIKYTSSENQKNVIFIAQNYSPIFIILLSVIFAPFSEEIVFRLCIFKFLKKYNRYFAYVLSILIFSILHIMNEILNVKFNFLSFLQLLNYVWPTIIITRYYDKNENIIFPMGIHFINNLVGILLVFAQSNL